MWSQVKSFLVKYNLPQSLDEIKNLSKVTFKGMVNKAVATTAFEELKAECGSLKKTADLSYDTFKLQGYLSKLFPNQARVVLKGRCKTLDIKTHNTYMYREDIVCRGCGVENETLQHVLNCGYEECLNLDVSRIDTDSDNVVTKLIQAVNRITSFKEMCEEKENTQKSKAAPPQNCGPSQSLIQSKTTSTMTQ